MPRSAIIWTRSRELSLNVRYHRTHRTIISWSKCRPPEELLCGGRFCHPSRYRRKSSLSSLHQNPKTFRTGSFVPFTIILEWSRCLRRNMRIPPILQLSVMKADPKTKAPFDQEQTARCKTFIWLPFVGGLSPFAVVLPQPVCGKTR